MFHQYTAAAPRRHTTAARRPEPATAKMTLAFRCVDVPDHGPELEAMQEMTDNAQEISFQLFVRHVDWKPIARDMGYRTEPGDKDKLLLSKDWSVHFYKSKFKGEEVYYMRQSAIEYVFKRQPASQAMRPRNPWG